MLCRVGVGLAMLALFVPSVRADERVIDQAEATIRWLITSSVEWERVAFDESQEQFLSFSEARVVGEGVASERRGWSGVRFRYTIKVHRNDLRTRDARVEFEDGRVLTSRDDWTEARPPSTSRVRFESPRRFEELSSRNVTFRGVATDRKTVTITVYDRRGRERGRRTAVPDRRGRWSTIIRLEPGSYKAEAVSDRWSEGDEVRFSVERSDGDWGFGGSGGSWGGSGSSSGRVTIDRPRNGETITDGIVRCSGRADSDEVSVQVYRGSRLVHRSDQKVFGGSWSAGPRLDSGNYRLVVEARRGRGRQEVSFSVRTSNFGGSGGSFGSSVSIERPRSGDTLSGSAYFSGRADSDRVDVLVYSGSRVVYRTSARVSGGRWSATARLDRGNYRLVVEASGGRGRDQADFSVR